jgi:hypothetical protein
MVQGGFACSVRHASDGYERGPSAPRAQDAAEGEALARVPLRLALTDHAGDEESDALLGRGGHWATRLAARLLRQRAAGAASPWAAYLRVRARPTPSQASSVHTSLKMRSVRS